ncbi:hypothetical protein D5F01_LYC24203 [Larimichthys crocea]|uniref:Uncharacterized protein n=1 Tax=Larimichthys crocea TaxID=215358 RepID=A0A6G0HFG2_LARCR|nr:hypothetical protein D5F01_LYC24203 [Larimichthys crocea]
MIFPQVSTEAEDSGDECPVTGIDSTRPDSCGNRPASGPEGETGAPSITSGPLHQFVLPPNLEGQAPVLRPGRRPAAATGSTHHTTPQHRHCSTNQLRRARTRSACWYFVLNPDNTLSPVLVAPGVSTHGPGPAPLGPAPPHPVSRFTERNRRRRALEEEGGVAKRRYVRGVAYNTCGKCGQPKTKDFGHSRYGSATFCPQASEGKSLEEWLEEQRPLK